MPSTGWVAGEASADLLGAELLEALRQQTDGLQAVGIGGAAMQQQGLRSLFDADRLAVMGLIEPLFRLPELLRMRRRLADALLRDRPDIFIGIDAPDFNLALEQRLRSAGIPVIHYVSPSVWAWRRSRLKRIVRAVDCMFCLFPFELEVYRQSELPAHCIGHPMARIHPLRPPPTQRQDCRQALGLIPKETVIALMPGSRQSEVRYNLPVMLQTARLLAADMPEPYRFVICAATPERRTQIEQAMAALLLADEAAHFVVCQDASTALTAANAALVVMGTVALQAALCRTPVVSMYRTNPVNYHLLTSLSHIDMYSLPNLLANERIIPEILQWQATPSRLASAVMQMLEKDQTSLLSRFADIHEQLLGEGVEAAVSLVGEYARW